MRILAASLLTLFMGSVSSAQPAKPLVYVLSTGARSRAPAPLRPTSRIQAGAILGEELVTAVPQINQFADVRVEQIVNVSSPDLTPMSMADARAPHPRASQGDPTVSGFVITSGTNTLEETPYFLNLTVPLGRPVVLVGAMRPRQRSAPTGR